MTKNKYLSLVILIIVTFSVSLLGGFVTNVYKEPWYSQIILPSFNPPSWIFSPVWGTLYLMMSVGAWFAWNKTKNTRLLNLYFIHLFFNGIWSVIFFGFHSITLALIDLVIILLFIIVLLKAYYKMSLISFYLFLPYFLWSTFALVLNTSIFLLN